MRLSEHQLNLILDIVARHAPGSRVSLFGSRLDDCTRGGDVDLLLETDFPFPRLKQARLLSALEARLGLPVDLVVIAGDRSTTAFERMIKTRATSLIRSSHECHIC